MSAGRPPIPIDVPEVLARVAGGESLVSLASEMGVSARTLSRRVKDHPNWRLALSVRRLKQQPAHGTLARYQRGRCRCDDCRSANAAAARRGRVARAHKTPPDRVHGTVGGYINWSCRCAPCRRAGRIRNRESYIRRQA